MAHFKVFLFLTIVLINLIDEIDNATLWHY
jgi:hypothetical protein